MQFLLEAWPGIQGASMDVGQIRRLIRQVFPDADVRHQRDERGDLIEVDDAFAILKATPADDWALCRIVRVPGVNGPGYVEHRYIMEGSERQAVEWLIERVALGRLEKARRELRERLR
jgi:hypothetical protein